MANEWNNKEYVLEQVQEDYTNLEYASPKLKRDIDIAIEALRQGGLDAVNYIDLKALQNRNFLLAVLKAVPELKEEEDFLYSIPAISGNLDIARALFKPVEIKIGDINLVLLSPITEDILKSFKDNFKKAISAIIASPLRKFKSVLKGHLILGEIQDITNIFIPDEDSFENIEAFYNGSSKKVVYNQSFLYFSPNPTHHNLVHEYAHKYHHLILKSSPLITQLYERAMLSESECELAQLPKIGDPLSDITESREWSWKVGSSEHYLREVGVRGYVYIDSKGDEIILSKKDILNRIKCPSQYGAKNEREFFAEMCVLITFNKVKPSQRLIANKFLEIVNSL